MKRFLFVLGAALLAVSLLGCASAEPAQVNAPEEPVVETIAIETIACEATASPAALDALKGTLAEISVHYFPGTAGCSLQAAKYAGTLLDWYAETRPAAEDVTAAAEAFYAGLDLDAGAVFNGEQIDGIYAAACELLDETAPDYLDSAGYRPTHYPWAETDVTALFSALYAGVGLAFPE